MQDKFCFFYKKRIENMDFELLKSRINNRKVYIWGADHKGIWLRDVLIQNNVSVEGFIDRSVKNVHDAQVKNPTDIIYKGSADKYFVIVSMFLKHEKEVTEFFLINEYSHKDYYYPYKDWNFVYGSINKRFDYLADTRYQRGKELSNSLEDDKFYFLLFGGHIGDEILALSWLKAFKEQHYIKEIIVITSSLYSQLTRLYPDECQKVEVWSNENLDALRIYSISGSSTKYNLVGANWIWFPLEYQIPFPMNQTVYKTMHLGLPNNVKSEYFNTIPDRELFNKIVAENGIVEGKSVLLIPYSKSAKNLPLSFWEKLAKKLSENYVVFTNVGKNETAIKGTKPLFIPLDMVAAVVNFGGYAVSTRCGISDILALGMCENAFILYYLWNDIEVNYSKIDRLYVNGEESILYKNAISIRPSDNEVDVIRLIESKLRGEKNVI